MNHGQYLLVLVTCLVVTLPLELLGLSRVYHRWRRLLACLLVVAVVFSVWDVAGIIRGHWTYNARFITGIHLPFRMPIEELAFFLVIPVCGLLTYEAVGTLLRRTGPDRARSALEDPGRRTRLPEDPDA